MLSIYFFNLRASATQSGTRWPSFPKTIPQCPWASYTAADFGPDLYPAQPSTSVMYRYFSPLKLVAHLFLALQEASFNSVCEALSQAPCFAPHIVPSFEHRTADSASLHTKSKWASHELVIFPCIDMLTTNANSKSDSPSFQSPKI